MADCLKLSQNECNYCHGFGHTTKYCAKIAAKNSNRSSIRKKNKMPDSDGFSQPKKIQRSGKFIRIAEAQSFANNKFAALDSAPMKSRLKAPLTVDTSCKGSWGKPLKILPLPPIILKKITAKPIAEGAIAFYKKTATRISWADQADTDSDDD
tara:strand:- start:922 stop:1380 length:459 start_codon:yes stop_codon:yes gene_type:complete